MANVVKKGAGRASHAEKTNRHAQRTPLPPRPGQIEAARAEVSKSLESTESLPDVKSWGKAASFEKLAVAANWSVSHAARGEAVEVTATRGPETIVQAWRGGVWQWDASVYAFADRTTKPRNASGAAKLLERPAEAAQAETAKVNANQAFRRKAPTELKTIVLPLDPELLTNEEATKYFGGRTVKWYNRQGRKTETATVSRSVPVRVTRHGDEVTIWFHCSETGFRAFHLSAVLAVGQGRVATTKGSEFASVELVTEDLA